MKLLANGKLNLYLKVIGKKSNGYHLLNMINVPIDLYDHITLETTHSNSPYIKQSFSLPIDCPLEKSTLYKAFEFAKRHINLKHGYVVTVEKHIPMGSGMGGGSSDAAVFLKEILKDYTVDFNEVLLSEIAHMVGADVPFFIYNKPAFIEGIGEKITILNDFPTLYFVIVVPDFNISTRWAYENFKLPLTKEKDNINIKNSKIDLFLLLEIMENDLEKAVVKSYPKVLEVKNFLESTGALKAMMTGSGSAVFGLFDDMAVWEKAFITAEKFYQGYKVFKCKTIGV